MYHVLATGRLMELTMWNRQMILIASDMETLCYKTRCVVKALADVQHWKIIEMYLNTAIQQHIIQFTAFDAHTKQILKEVF
jgi:DNA-binding sugar fermentation-stimulating protein